MATIDTTSKARTALEIARTTLLGAVPAVSGEPAEQRLSRLANGTITESVGADYQAALDAQIG